MQEVFEKIIEKLKNELKLADEEKLRCERENPLQFDSAKGYANGVANSIEIVKQEADMYNNAIVDGKYCFQTCACTEKCDKCSRLCNGDIDWYENIDNWTEYYNNGWIPCSECLPENISTVVVQVKEIEKPTFGWFGNMTGWRLTEKDFTELKDFIVVAWQPLPEPYHPKGE